MRITSNITVNNSLYNIQQNRGKLEKLEELATSGNNVNRPSDDPATARYLYEINDKINAADQYISNIDKATTWQRFTDVALEGIADSLALAKKIANGITNGNIDPAVRQNVMSQLTALKQQIVDIGNTRLGDQYVFGGANNAAAPFSTVTPYYSGDETTLNVEVGSNTTQRTNVSGNQILTGSTLLVAPPEPLPYGSTNVLKAFDDLITAVNANDVANIKLSTQAIEDGSKQITNARSDVASRMIRLESAKKINENNKNTLETFFGNIQSVDYAKLGVALNQQKTAFEAALSTSAKVSQMSLLDYL